jgi:hypothetical protein
MKDKETLWIIHENQMVATSPEVMVMIVTTMKAVLKMMIIHKQINHNLKKAN